MAQIRAGMGAPQPTIRAGAVRALAEQGDKPGAAELGRRALDDEAPEVVAEALRTVGAQTLHGHRDRAVSLLSHEAPQVRLAAAEVLAAHARPAHVPVLRDRLSAEPEPQVRAELVRALARLGGPIATATLAEVERSDPDEYVRQAASSGLRRMLR